MQLFEKKTISFTSFSKLYEDENDEDYAYELEFIRKLVKGEVKPDEFEYYSDYVSTLKSEASNIKGKTLFIGSGPYPISPMLLHDMGVDVDGMDYSAEAIDISKTALDLLNISGIDLFQADGTTYNGYGKYDTIIVALEAGNTEELKQAIVNKIAEQVSEDAHILVRSSNTDEFVNVSEFLKENYEIVAEIPIFSGMSSTFVIKVKK